MYYNANSRRIKKRKKQNKIDIYVVRINTKKFLAESKPCNECVNAMKYAGIRYVYYSTHDGKICREKVKDMQYTYITRIQEHSAIVTGIKAWIF